MISYTSYVFFILFFGIAFLIYSLVPQRAKWTVLLGGSLVFYVFSTKAHILPLIVSSLVVWALGIWIQKLNDNQKIKLKEVPKADKKALKAKFNTKKQMVITLGVIVTFGILLLCKYSNFFIGTTNSIFNTNYGEIDIIQPLGISFYTLQAISYLTDIHRKRIEAEKNPFRVLLYLSFMLTIVEGPVARYDQLGKELNEGKKFDAHRMVYGVVRITWGLFKKVVVADRLAMIANGIFDNHYDYSGVVVGIAILSYTLQLYLEFSGIMDVVCGLGEMLSIKLPENFRQPFFAKTINEFWQRWHITLGAWLKDYIFYSISLSKMFKNITKSARKKFNLYYANIVPTAFALFFVWFGNGFWHGAGWKYICYGLYYYVLMMSALFMEPLFEKVCSLIKLNRKTKAYSYFQIVRTFLVVNFGMLIFRADTLNVAFSMFKSLFVYDDVIKAFSDNVYIGLDLKDYAIIVIGLIIVFVVSLMQEKGRNVLEIISKRSYAFKFVFFFIMIYSVIIFGAYGDGYGVVDLIYANF